MLSAAECGFASLARRRTRTLVPSNGLYAAMAWPLGARPTNDEVSGALRANWCVVRDPGHCFSPKDDRTGSMCVSGSHDGGEGCLDVRGHGQSSAWPLGYWPSRLALYADAGHGHDYSSSAGK